MTYLILFEMVVLAAFVYCRPHWRAIGPSLVDAYVVSLLLAATGAQLVWNQSAESHAEAVARIHTVTATGGIAGAALWSYVTRQRHRGAHFLTMVRTAPVMQGEYAAITIGLVVCTLICLAYLILIVTNPALVSMIVTGLLQRSNVFWRLAIAGGKEGYLAVGYVKQFRDMFIPMLVAAAVLLPWYRWRWLVLFSIATSAAAMFITGDRMPVLQFMLSLVAALIVDRLRGLPPVRRLLPAGWAIVIVACFVGMVGLMTLLAGHVEAPKTVAKKNAAPTEKTVANSTKRRLGGYASLTDSIESELKGYASFVFDVGHAVLTRSISQLPLENAQNYEKWAPQAPRYGRGWIEELSLVKPGKQFSIANRLVGGDKAGQYEGAASPLSMPCDLYYNWGMIGAALCAALFALGFLWFDLSLVASRSMLLYGAKFYLFFAIPVIYSPYGFLLYGGAAALAIWCYHALLKRGALRFLGLRPQLITVPYAA